MGLSTPLMATHDDSLHLGSAKRAVANGVASLDASAYVPAAELALAELLTRKDAASGYAGLDVSTLLSLAQQRLNFAVGTFTRDMTAASGNVAYTGVGFVPRLVLFFALIPGTSVINFIGIMTASSNISLRDDAISSAGTYYNSVNFCIYLQPAAGVTQAAAYSSFGADGFTLTWTKAGAPTGTANIYYIAVR